MYRISVRLAFLTSWAGLVAEGQENASTYSEHIEPILRTNCIECHRPGGSAPFSLLDYESVSKRSRQISEVVEDRYMPPWKPDPHFTPPLVGERGLSEEEIQALVSWHENGAPAGELSTSPPVANLAEWQSGEPDLVLELSSPYTLPAEGKDIYRNFVISNPLNETRYVSKVDLSPSSRTSIHHALILLDQTESSQERDLEEPGPGFASMHLGKATSPRGHLVGWTPGRDAIDSYPGTAWKLKPGDDIVLQLHMLPNGKPQEINPKIGLYFSESPPTRPTRIIQLRNLDINIPAGASNHKISSQFELPVDVSAIGLYPHAHYLGKDLKLFAILPSGQRQWLMRIPDWDFNWQSDYRFQEPIPLPKGSVIHMEYIFDNSETNFRNPNTPPINVQGGWNSDDEMAEAAIQVMVDSNQQAEQIDQALLAYQIQTEGSDVVSYYLGRDLEEAGEMAEAVKAYEVAITENPKHGPSLTRLAAIAMRSGKQTEALALFRAALSSDPQSSAYAYNLAKAEYQAKALPSCVATLTTMLETHPQHIESRLLLARIYMEQGWRTKSIQLIRDGVDHSPHSPALALQLAKFLLVSGKPSAAIDTLSRIVSTDQYSLEKSAIERDSLMQYKSEAAYVLSIAYQNNGYIEKSNSALVTASTFTPAYIPALAALANHYAQEGTNDHLNDVSEKMLRQQSSRFSISEEQLLELLSHPDAVASYKELSKHD